jgi:hypothetical protein
VGPNESAKASSPVPAANADNKTYTSSVGSGNLSVKTSEPYYFWTEQIDLQGYGKVASTDFLFDSARDTLYAYRTDDFTCANGETGRGDILEAIYTKGNHRKPVGSGWYVVALNEGQCGARQSGDYGCRFDAVGNPTECGRATVNYETGDVDIRVE